MELGKDNFTLMWGKVLDRGVRRVFNLYALMKIALDLYTLMWGKCWIERESWRARGDQPVPSYFLKKLRTNENKKNSENNK